MRLWAPLLLVCAAGCGAFNPSGGGDDFTLEDRAVTPTQAADAGTVSHDLGAKVQLVGAGADYIVASTESGAFRMVGTDDPRPMSFVDDAGISDPGAITAIASRQPPPQDPNQAPQPASYILASGARGVLQDFTDYFERSPLSDHIAANTVALDDTGSGSTEVVWAGTQGGALRFTATGSDKYTIPGESAAPSAVLEVDSALALVAFGGHVYNLHYASSAALQLPHDFGQVHAMARGGLRGSAYLATSTGLYARDPQGHFIRRFAGTDIGALFYDTVSGLYFTTGNSLLLLKDDGTAVQVGALDSGVAHPLAVDGFGDVWVGSGNTLLQFHVGQTVGYLNQIKPFLATYCYSCHVTQVPGTPAGTPKLPFDNYDGTRALAPEIVARVQGQGASGPMPPPPPMGKGQLAPSEYGVVIRWFRSGELP